MPMLDMRVALSNPYTIDYFTVIRRVETVNDFGESTLTTTSYPLTAGVVTAGQPSNLDRQANFQVTPKWIDIVTQFCLYPESESGAGTEYQPDLIVWRGNNYIVKTLADYSSYGLGFVSAGCAITDSQQRPTGSLS
jgi:hypothetical protein